MKTTRTEYVTLHHLLHTVELSISLCDKWKAGRHFNEVTTPVVSGLTAAAHLRDLWTRYSLRQLTTNRQ